MRRLLVRLGRFVIFSFASDSFLLYIYDSGCVVSHEKELAPRKESE